MKKLNLIMLGSVSAIFVVSIIYYFLGGFRPIQLEVLEQRELIVAGREYDGRDGSAELERTFRDMQALIAQNPDLGSLVVISDDGKFDSNKRTVSYFIGVEWNLAGLWPDQDLELRRYQVDQVVRATITSHNLVMKTSEKVRRDAQQLAIDQNISLSNLSFERYLNDNRLIVEFPSSDVRMEVIR